MIEVRCLHSLSDAQPFRAAMNALNLASARPDPFSTFEFFANHLRNAVPDPATSQLWLLLAFIEDRLVGYLALKLCGRRVLGLPAAKLELLTAFKADRPQLVVACDAAAAVRTAIYAYIFGRSNEWSLLEFAQQDAASALLPLPAQATSGAYSFRQWPNLENGSIAVRWDSSTAYFAALSRKSRSNVSRQMRTLLAAGNVQLLTSSDRETLPPLFELYRGVEAQSWKARTDVAFEGVNQRMEYFTELMEPDQPMRITIQVLLLDGVPIAGLITGAFARGLYALHIVYDDRYGRLAPGSAILLMGMRLAIEGGYEFFNLLQGFGYYKARWLAQMTGTQSLQIFRIGSPFYWRRVLGDAKRRWFGTAPVDEVPLSNPSRRAAAGARVTDVIESRAQVAISGEHARFAAVIARTKRGRGEFLSSQQLVAALPFATTAAPAVPTIQQPASKARTSSRARTDYRPSGTTVGPANAAD
jgi:hypothetical protein